MRKIYCHEIREEVARLCQEANFFLPKDVLTALKKAKKEEASPFGQSVLEQILKNNRIAAKKRIPICQDCGTAVVFLEIGESVQIVGGNVSKAVKDGVRQGYAFGYLRKSLCDPLTRKNTGDNTPPVIHVEFVPGDNLKIIVCPKGGGAENMSALEMLKPSQGMAGVKEFVVNRVKEAGSNPCPPIVVGVGIGGNFETVALSAKKALLRPIGSRHQDPDIAALEEELLKEINKLGIGPAGLGGYVTCLAVHIEKLPCHIASFPVAANINCHAARHKEAVL